MKTLLEKSLKYTFLLIAISMVSSCGTRKDIVYFQNIDQIGATSSINEYTPTIRPDDMLTITVSALDQDAVRPFNLPTVTFGSNGSQLGRERLETYLVDSSGNIDFPVLGKLKLSGLTRIQATQLIKDMLKDYLKDPIVNIRTVNFKVTILGEVTRPGSYTIPNDRITILEALGLASDLTLQGQRNNVLVIREINNKTISYRVDLTSEEVFSSPYYYLTQNDVIYVEPNNSRIKSSSVGPNVGATLSFISTLVTVAALIVSITR
ncbi:MAG: polysaccharide biosynthesis/export family protein [Flavobacteriaceae bacterium]|nr:polysaccharide biosynthesis/export family protein [Flavobacteriaceae bacterium]